MTIFSSSFPSEISRRRYVLSCLLAALLFLLLLVLVTQVQQVSRWDAMISEWIQAYRSPAGDRIMVLITLSADQFVTSVIVAALVAFLLYRQHWWLAVHLVCVYLSTRIGVAIVKVLVSRARPEIVDSALAYYSFPSGHAAAAAVVAGLLGVVLAYQQSRVVARLIYAVAALLALLVAISRVYLLAHWPSDVIAGLAIGFSLAVTFAWQLHRDNSLDARRLPTILALTGALAIAIHAYRTFDEQAIRYAIVS